jgi:hypothetical protein
VSATTWSLFGLANVGMYIYTARYFEWQAIAGPLLTAVLDFVIAVFAIAARKSQRPQTASAIPEAEQIPNEELVVK